MILNLLQTTLDTTLYPVGVLSHWQKKTGPDANEYIVYRMAGDASEDFADDEPLTKNASVTLNYYYRTDLINTYAGRQVIQGRIEAIQEALKTAGFTVPFGPFDAGDVDDIGYMVTVFECDYWRGVG